MITKLFSLFDRKTKIFHPPIYCHNTGHALRVYQSALKNGQSNMISEYPEDFTIYQVGSFDDNNGQITGVEQPEFICQLEDLTERPLDEDKAKKTSHINKTND